MSRQNLIDELNELSPYLANMEEDICYDTPVGYFKTLPDKLVRRVNKQAYIKKLYWISTAAAATIAIILFSVIQTNPIAASPAENVYFDYISQHLEDIEEETIFELIDDEFASIQLGKEYDQQLEAYIEQNLDQLDLDIIYK